MLASHDGQRRRTKKLRSGATVITKVMTRNSGATMLAADRRPAPITMRPATIKIAKNGGPGRWPATGMGSGRACAVTVLPDMVGLPSVGWVIRFPVPYPRDAVLPLLAHADLVDVVRGEV